MPKCEYHILDLKNMNSVLRANEGKSKEAKMGSWTSGLKEEKNLNLNLDTEKDEFFRQKNQHYQKTIGGAAHDSFWSQ